MTVAVKMAHSELLSLISMVMIAALILNLVMVSRPKCQNCVTAVAILKGLDAGPTPIVPKALKVCNCHRI